MPPARIVCAPPSSPAAEAPPTSRATGTYDPSRFEFAQLPEHKLSRLELSIEGQSLRNGQPVASSVITQELGVVPKCCGVSIGDTDTVPENYCASRFPRLIVGLNGGGVMNAGGRSELVEQVAGSNRSSTNLPNQVLCVNSSGVCGGAVTSSVGGVPISTIKLTPPPLPAYPAVDNRTNTATGNTGMIIHSNTAMGATSTLATSANAKDYLRVNSSGVVQLCNVTNTALMGVAEPPMPQAFVNSSCDSTINQFCARTGNSSENYTYHCRIARLHVRDQPLQTNNPLTGEASRIQNNTFFIDSSRGRIFLHFNQSWINPASCGLPEDSPSIETICTQAGFNDGQIQHLHCSTAPNDSSPCNLRAAPDNAARAGLYSDAPINLKVGDDGYVRDLFVYMPKGSLILAEDPYTVDNAFGLPNYRGPLWINNLWMGVRGDVAYQTQIAMPPLLLLLHRTGQAFDRQPLPIDAVLRMDRTRQLLPNRLWQHRQQLRFRPCSAPPRSALPPAEPGTASIDRAAPKSVASPSLKSWPRGWLGR